MGLKKLGEILVERGACKPEDINEALKIQKEIGGKIGTVLLNSGIISEGALLEALSQQLQIPLYAEVAKNNPEIVPIKGIPLSFFITHKIFPFYQNDEEIWVATDDPLKIDAFIFLENGSGKSIVPYLLSSDELRIFENLCELQASDDVFDIDEEEEDRLKELASEAPVIKLVNNIFSKAIKAHASDIHYESYKEGIHVRFRIDGRLREIEKIPQNLKLAVIARLKLISKMNISENRLPQDGRISLKISGSEFDVRASSVPTAFGESFVLRLLGKESISYDLDYLDFYEDTMKLLREIAASPNGIFLTTGPTGSGKTTTLYSLLNELNTEETKIITVEDPVEYQLEGISQIQVRSDLGFTFANALRSILRQDPDIIMIGEIRDVETAQIAVQSALTGHLVISTLHTNSALGAITRLKDMGIDYFLLKSSVIGLMAQRLVRRLCPHCKKAVPLDPQTRKKFKVDEILAKYPIIEENHCVPVGCELCHGTGFRGRLPIVEIGRFDDNIKEAFEEGGAEEEDIARFGYRNMYEDGILKALEGKTTIEEVIRVTHA